MTIPPFKIPARADGLPCPRCGAPAVGYAIHAHDDAACGSCDYTAPLDEYLIAAGAPEEDLWTLAVGRIGRDRDGT